MNSIAFVLSSNLPFILYIHITNYITCTFWSYCQLPRIPGCAWGFSWPECLVAVTGQKCWEAKFSWKCWDAKPTQALRDNIGWSQESNSGCLILGFHCLSKKEGPGCQLFSLTQDVANLIQILYSSAKLTIEYEKIYLNFQNGEEMFWGELRGLCDR